jgi:hypothetical protein
MATPKNFTRTVASGVDLYAGLTAPGIAAPAWMTNAVIGQYTLMPNSIGSAGAAANIYSSFVIDDGLRLWIAAAGGHHDSDDNRVVKYDASVDNPTGWVVANPASVTKQEDVAYYSDGKPTSRHLYDYMVYSPELRRVLLIGAQGAWGLPLGFNTIDGFNVDTNQWDPAGTYPYTYGTALASSGGGAWGTIRDPNTGAIYFANQSVVKKWTPGQATVGNVGTSIALARFPNAFDTSRSAIFGLMWGDGQNSGSGVAASQTLDVSGGSPVKRTITFNASAGLTAFQSNAPAYAGMDYDVINDKFVFASGAVLGSGAPRLYQITPNESTVWDIEVLSPAGSPGNVVNGGVNGRVKYVRRGSVGGFIISFDSNVGYFFLRTA